MTKIIRHAYVNIYHLLIADFGLLEILCNLERFCNLIIYPPEQIEKIKQLLDCIIAEEEAKQRKRVRKRLYKLKIHCLYKKNYKKDKNVLNLAGIFENM